MSVLQIVCTRGLPATCCMCGARCCSPCLVAAPRARCRRRPLLPPQPLPRAPAAGCLLPAPMHAAAVLQPWDQEFYSRQLAASQPATAAAAAAAPYLQLSSVLAGLSELLTQLMGLRLVQQPLPPGEAWAPGAAGAAGAAVVVVAVPACWCSRLRACVLCELLLTRSCFQLSHPLIAPSSAAHVTGLLKFAVECRQEGRLGVLYLDLCGRPGKVPSSGILYPLRCGRQLPGARRGSAACLCCGCWSLHRRPACML